MPEEIVVPAAEAVEQPAASEVQGTNATESATGDSTESQPEAKPKVTGGFQKRIDKLTREKEHWKEQALAALTKPVASPAPTETVAPVGKPKADDFATHNEFVEALTDWKVNEKVKAFEAKETAKQAATQQQTIAQTFEAREKEFKAATPDFDEVLAEADFPVSQALIHEIVTSDNGPQLKYFLAKNPDEAERLSKLAPLALAKEVGRIESRFATTPSAKTATVSKAPAPPTPVSKSSATSSKDPGEMTQAEYKVWRAKAFPNSKVF